MTDLNEYLLIEQVAALKEQLAALTAERDSLREAVKDMLHIFDRGLAEGTIGRIVCERAWQALDELKPKPTTTGEQGQ